MLVGKGAGPTLYACPVGLSMAKRARLERGVQLLDKPTPELIRLINRRLPSDTNLILDVTC